MKYIYVLQPFQVCTLLQNKQDRFEVLGYIVRRNYGVTVANQSKDHVEINTEAILNENTTVGIIKGRKH